MGITPQELIEKSKLLKKLAYETEKKRFAKLGKIVNQYEKNDFKNFEITKFKEQISKVDY